MRLITKPRAKATQALMLLTLGFACPSLLSAGTAETSGKNVATIEEPSRTDSVPFRLTPRGVALEDDHGALELGLFAPIYQTPAHLVFADVRGSHADERDPGYSLGLGYRFFAEHPGLIAGANVFFDSSQIDGGDRQDQIGLGLEILTTRFDFRANGYLPLGDEERIHSDRVNVVSHVSGYTIRESFTLDHYENPLEGIDAEVGVLVPWLDRYTDLRVFGGVYFANSTYSEDIESWYARGEWSPVRALVFEAGYAAEFDDADQGAWYAGIRLNFEFGGGASSKQVAGLDFSRSTKLADRRNEYIHRNGVVATEHALRISQASRTLQVRKAGQTVLAVRGSKAADIGVALIPNSGSDSYGASSMSGAVLVSGASFGSGGIIKTGIGGLVLSGESTIYPGSSPAVINGGTISLGSGASVGGPSFALINLGGLGGAQIPSGLYLGGDSTLNSLWNQRPPNNP